MEDGGGLRTAPSRPVNERESRDRGEVGYKAFGDDKLPIKDHAPIDQRPEELPVVFINLLDLEWSEKPRNQAYLATTGATTEQTDEMAGPYFMAT